MKRNRRFVLILIYGLLMACIPSAASIASPIIIDHTSIAAFSTLSDTTIDAVQDNLSWHYAHTSHGSQITTGLGRIEASDNRFNVTITGQSLPTTPGALNVFDGQEHDTYITPDEYWESAGGIQDTQDVLDNNPTINISGWSWCTQPNYYSDTQIVNYLNAMADFETANPDITFIYMTGNAQAGGSTGYDRYRHNEMIRNWVSGSSNRVLFDFADLDSWWFNPDTGLWEQETYLYEGYTVAIEHAMFNGNEAGHTTYASTEQKGRAAWVMMAEVQAASQVPVPGAVWLLGSGMLFLLGARKKHLNRNV